MSAPSSWLSVTAVGLVTDTVTVNVASCGLFTGVL